MGWLWLSLGVLGVVSFVSFFIAYRRAAKQDTKAQIQGLLFLSLLSTVTCFALAILYFWFP
jgi:hypothetical protein